MKRIVSKPALPIVALLLALVAPPTLAVAADPVFAVVEGEVIDRAEYDRAVTAAARSRFYHREVPEDEFTAFRREVAQSLIDDRLLMAEAQRRGIAPDAAWVAERVEAADRRYRSEPGWDEKREGLLATLRGHLERRSQVRGLEAQVRALPAADEARVQAFYAANPALFTEPLRNRVAVILLKVDPAAGPETWAAAQEEGDRLVQRLRDGADFAELAALHSQDATAKSGGDLGYLHEGMLGSSAQTVIDALEPGRFSDAVQLLEGVVIFRLLERQAARLSPYETVAERARELWLRERREQVWQEFLGTLRAGARIEIADPELRELLQAAPAQGGPTAALVSKRDH